jgi:hypothetical protein
MTRTAEIPDDEIVKFIQRHIEKYHTSPAYRDFVKLGITSSSHARYRVKQLVEAGRLGYTPGIARSIYIKKG